LGDVVRVVGVCAEDGTFKYLREDREINTYFNDGKWQAAKTLNLDAL